MSMSRPPAISATGLRKSFGDHVVLDGIDLSVDEGSVFALLGPNGAGKTTMVDILCTLSRADAGVVLVGGHDVIDEPEAVRAAIAVTGQFSAVDNLLTGEENLRLMADLRHLGREEGRRRIADLLERFDLGEAARQAGRHLLRGHAPQARPRDGPGGQPPHRLPRRADHRPGPAQPPDHVGHRPRTRRRRRDHLPDDAVPRRGRPARRPDRGPRRRPARRRGHGRRAQATGSRRHPPPDVPGSSGARVRGRRAARERPPLPRR